MKDYCPAAIINYCAVHLITFRVTIRIHINSAACALLIILLLMLVAFIGCGGFYLSLSFRSLSLCLSRTETLCSL